MRNFARLTASPWISGAAVLLMLGCSMTPLGTGEYTGQSRFYAKGPKSSLDFKTTGPIGEDSAVTVTLKTGEKCTGVFKLIEMDSSCWNVICTGHHRYDGHFDAGLPAACRQLMGNAGNEPLTFRSGIYREFWIVQRRSIVLLDAKAKRLAGPWTFDPPGEPHPAPEHEVVTDSRPDDDE